MSAIYRYATWNIKQYKWKIVIWLYLIVLIRVMADATQVSNVSPEPLVIFLNGSVTYMIHVSILYVFLLKNPEKSSIVLVDLTE